MTAITRHFACLVVFTMTSVGGNARAEAELIDAIPEAAHPNEASIPSDAVLTKIADSLGLTLAQMKQYLKVSRETSVLRGLARTQLGADFAGAYLSRRNGKFSSVVNGRSGGRIPDLGQLQPSFAQVAFSLEDLRNIQNQIEASVSANDRLEFLQSTGIDVSRNKVILGIDSGKSALANQLLSQAKIPRSAVAIEEYENRISPTPALYGGQAWNSTPTHIRCSIGFSTFVQSSTGLGVYTAGHCADENDPFYSYSGALIGTFQESTFPVSDHAWVAVTGSGWSVEPYVLRYSVGGAQPVAGNQTLGLYDAVCHSGLNTGYNCGIITQENATYTDTLGNTLAGVSIFSACGGAGDSGGSIISVENEAQGIFSGTNLPSSGDSNCGETYTIRSVIVPLQTAANASPNAVLRTLYSCGRLTSGYSIGGPGFATRPEVNACTGAYKLGISSSGWLAGFVNGSPQYNIVFVGVGGKLHMETSGELVARNSSNQMLWSSGTGTRGAELRVLPNSEMQVVSNGNQLLWRYCPVSNLYQACSNPSF